MSWKNHANETYLQYTNYTAAEDIKRLNFIVTEVGSKFPSGAKILDVGCGNGNISRALGSLGHQVLGIDLSPESVRKATELNTFPNVAFQVINAEQLQIERDFDVVVCSEVLEHLNEPQLLVKELSRLVATGKLLIVTVPNGYGPRELLVTKPVIWLEKNNGKRLLVAVKRLLGYANATVQSSNPDLTHIQFFTKKALFNLLTPYNFELRSFKNANFIEKVFPLSILAKRSSVLQRLDCHLADYLPSGFSSGFYTSWVKK